MLQSMSLPPYLHPFFSLSYPTKTPANVDSFPDSSYYNIGLLDICFIITCIAVMAILRDGLRLGVFEPLAQWVLEAHLRGRKRRLSTQPNGNFKGSSEGEQLTITLKEQKKIRRSVVRFAEQGWSLVYYTLQWCYGVYIHYNLPTKLLHPVDLWIGYPHLPLAGPVKFYYLTETAFYLHQVFILNAEERRKDHIQMMTHHVITVFLMGMSYSYNLTRVGCLIMVLMDWCDIILPLGKMMHYLEFRQIYCDTAFGTFLLSWFVTRHVLFIIVIASVILDVPAVLPYAWDPATGKYLTFGAKTMFTGCLVALQILQIIWFWTICKVAWRVVSTGEGASDDRSDDEADKDK